MQVTQTHSEGLRHEYKIVVPVSDLDARVDSRVSELKNTVQLKGFRPGKVPPAHLKKLYGRSLMAEAIEALVRETNAKIVTDNGYKLAMEPKVTMPEAEHEIEGVLTGEIKVPTERELTFYARHGELFAKVCAAITVLAILIIFGVRRWKRV